MSRKRTCVALLRGINVGGRNKVPMADLRGLCVELGWESVRTYIQSGNVVFSSAAAAGRLEAGLEDAIAERLGLEVPVIVRTRAAWNEHLDGNPFVEASSGEPKLVMLALAKKKPAKSALDVLRERAAAGESVTRVGDALWIHYANGSARSKLSPSVLDRAAGSPVTTRNWKTVQKLADMMS